MINKYTAKSFCCEDISLIENYDNAIADTTQTWECHHRGEVLPCGRFSRDDLKKFGLYYSRPAAELIFLTPSAHRQLHLKGVPLSEEHKKALSEALKGVQLSEATKKAISEALKGVPLSEEHKKAIGKAHKGVPLSEEHKKAIGKAHKGVPLSEATKKAISDAMKGVPKSEEHRAKLSKKVLQFTKSGEFIREWPSVREAERELGIARSNICSCCNEKLKSAGGYIWKYA